MPTIFPCPLTSSRMAVITTGCTVLMVLDGIPVTGFQRTRSPGTAEAGEWMLGLGEPVLYRKLWNGAVMTALPMRVVSDSPDRTVLYLAPDTPFKGARTPAGTKVRDFSSWVSMDLVWVGGSLIRLTEPETWNCVDVEFDAAGEFIGWYVNFQEPIRRARSRFDTVDLVLDLVVAPDRSWRLKDMDDFQRAVSDGHLTAGVENRVRAEAERMIAVLAADGSPFCESEWLGWRPPADWTVPSLPGDWAR